MHFYTWEANYRASCGVIEPTPASGRVRTFSLPRLNVGVASNRWNVIKHSLKCMTPPLENSKVFVSYFHIFLCRRVLVETSKRAARRLRLYIMR